MKVTKKMWDVTPARSVWGRYYAHLEYKRIVWHDLWEYCQYIEVKNG